MTICDLLSPVLSYVLLLTKTPDTRRQSGLTIRDHCLALLKQQRAMAVSQRVSMRDYDDAEFAVVAWIDETVMRAAHRDSNNDWLVQWQRHSLQKELFDTECAGEDFYKKLANLRPEQSAVRELYYFCLRLGFRGQYKEQSQEAQFAQVCRRYAQQLPVPLPEWEGIEQTAEHLTSQPYRAVPRPLPRHDWFLWGGVFVSIVLLIAGHAWLRDSL